MYVINFDYPSSSEDYVHRIGRTARANKSGTAYTFFTNENMKNARDLLQVLEEAKQEVNPALAQLASMAGSFSRGKNLISTVHTKMLTPPKLSKKLICFFVGRRRGGGRGDRDGGRFSGGGRGGRDDSRSDRNGGYANRDRDRSSGFSRGDRNGGSSSVAPEPRASRRDGRPSRFDQPPPHAHAPPPAPKPSGGPAGAGSGVPSLMDLRPMSGSGDKSGELRTGGPPVKFQMTGSKGRLGGDERRNPPPAGPPPLPSEQRNQPPPPPPDAKMQQPQPPQGSSEQWNQYYQQYYQWQQQYGQYFIQQGQQPPPPAKAPSS